MLGSLNFEQHFWSRTAKGNFKIGHDSIRKKEWLAYYDRSFHESIKYFDLRGSILKYFNENS